MKKGKLKTSSKDQRRQVYARSTHHNIEDVRTELRSDIARQQSIAERQAEIERELSEIITAKEARVAALRAMNVAERERMKARRALVLLDVEQ